MTAEFNWQRLVVGVLAVVLLAVGAWLYWTAPENAGGLIGVMIRIGLTLGVIWLAMPQLRSVESQISTGVLVMAIVLLVVAASRPNFFRVAVAILGFSFALNWALTWVAKFSKP